MKVFISYSVISAFLTIIPSLLYIFWHYPFVNILSKILQNLSKGNDILDYLRINF